jgi:SpoVK/Ycf46/Vps4 family AAA+-type ATPase
LDEIEKGLSGIQSSGRTDSGVTSRMFGTILTWMQEKKEPVFVVATANNIANLPSELLRKGRFDEIFFVDLPDLEERESIFEIQIRKYKRNPADFDLKALAKKSANYTGAEIEEAVVSALFDAWNNDAKELTTEDIIRSLEEMSPAAEGIMSETVQALREIAQGHNIRYATSYPTKRSDTENFGHAVRQFTPLGGNK